MTSFGLPRAGEATAGPPAAQPAHRAAPAAVARPAAPHPAARQAALATLAAARAGVPTPPRPVAVPVPVLARGPEPRRPVARPRSRVGVLRVVCWQLVLIAVLLVLDRPWPAITVVALAAVVVLALTAVRVRGRWLSEWVVLWAEYLRRNGDSDLPDADEAGRALLRLVSPEASGHTVEVNGEEVFTLSRTAGVTAVLHPSAVRDLTKALPAPQDLLPAPDEQGLAHAVQVVHHAGLDRARPPRVWIALQALRTVDVHQDPDVRRALGNAVRRVRRRLRRDGVPARPLTGPEVMSTLAALAHLTGGRGQVRERWRVWWSGRVSQAAFTLSGWDRLPPATAPQLLRWLLNAAPDATVTTAVTARRTGTGEPEVSAVLRIAALDPAAVERAARELGRLARERGVTLDRLDGRHALGLAATLPIGAG